MSSSLLLRLIPLADSSKGLLLLKKSMLITSRFYYADERRADGTHVGNEISGEAHGKFYLELAESTSQGPWQQTFVKDVGYKKF